MKGTLVDISRMHSEITGIFKEEGKRYRDYIETFFNIISSLARKLPEFHNHIIWEVATESFPGSDSKKEKVFLMDVTSKNIGSSPFQHHNHFLYPEINCLRLDREVRNFSTKVNNYLNHDEHFPLLNLPLEKEEQYITIPITTLNDGNHIPHLLITLIYKNNLKDIVTGKKYQEFLEFLSGQFSLGWAIFCRDIVNYLCRRIDLEIGEKDKYTSITGHELYSISQFLANEVGTEECWVYLADDAEQLLKPEANNTGTPPPPIVISLKDNTDLLATVYLQGHLLRTFNRGDLKSTALGGNIPGYPQAVLGLPISNGQATLGILSLSRRQRPFSIPETEILDSLSRHIYDIATTLISNRQSTKYIRRAIEQVTAPVKSLVGQAEDLIRKKVGDKKVQGKLFYIGTLSRVSLKYAANFERLLEFDAQTVIRHKERLYDLRDYLIGLAREYIPFIRKKCINIRITEKTKSKIDLLVDKELFHFAIANLIDNSVKYSFFPEERQQLGLQPKPTAVEDKENVLITAWEDNRKIIITISSYGLEILDHEREHLFKKGFRGEQAKTRHNVEPGYGLYIARKIFEIHSGTIELIPHTPRYNTCFKITLPRGEV